MQKLNCAEKSASYLDLTTNSEKQLNYDYVIVATGVRRQWPVVPQVSTHVEYVREGLKHVEAVATAKNGVVVVIGGGTCVFSFNDSYLLTLGSFLPLLDPFSQL